MLTFKKFVASESIEAKSENYLPVDQAVEDIELDVQHILQAAKNYNDGVIVVNAIGDINEQLDDIIKSSKVSSDLVTQAKVSIETLMTYSGDWRGLSLEKISEYNTPRKNLAITLEASQNWVGAIIEKIKQFLLKFYKWVKSFFTDVRDSDKNTSSKIQSIEDKTKIIEQAAKTAEHAEIPAFDHLDQLVLERLKNEDSIKNVFHSLIHVVSLMPETAVTFKQGLASWLEWISSCDKYIVDSDKLSQACMQEMNEIEVKIKSSENAGDDTLYEKFEKLRDDITDLGRKFVAHPNLCRVINFKLSSEDRGSFNYPVADVDPISSQRNKHTTESLTVFLNASVTDMQDVKNLAASLKGFKIDDIIKNSEDRMNSSLITFNRRVENCQRDEKRLVEQLEKLSDGDRAIAENKIKAMHQLNSHFQQLTSFYINSVTQILVIYKYVAMLVANLLRVLDWYLSISSEVISEKIKEVINDENVSNFDNKQTKMSRYVQELRRAFDSLGKVKKIDL